MRASTKRILSILLSGLFLIGLILISTSLIKPEFDGVMEKKATLYSKQNVFQNQSGAVEQVQELIQRFRGFDQLQNTVSLALPTEENTTQALNQITAVARNSGVQIISFQSSKEGFESPSQSLAERLGVIEIELGFIGTYDSVRGFVELLETNVRIFNVSEMVLESQQSEDGTIFVDGEVTFNVYYQE